MSDPKEPVTPKVGETVVATTSPPLAAAVEATKLPIPKAEEAEPHWLNARLERERAATLKKAGFESLEDAQASANEIKAKREAEKTTAEKAADSLARAKKAEFGEKALKEAVTEFATLQMTTLSAEQKAAVVLIAGEDPALQLKAIAALAPTWNKPAEAQKVAKAAADTVPPANAPSQTATSETNHRAQYESLRTSNPFLAATYGLAHATDVHGK